MGKTVGPKLLENILTKSVNGKESIPAQSSCHMASIQLSHGEESGKSSTYPQLGAGQIEWQEANTPFANH